MPETLGQVTKVVFFEEPEPGKLHLEFEASVALRKGQQVKLNADGTIVALAAADATHLCTGVLIQNVDANERATVAMRGYTVIYARAGAALNAGPVAIAAYDTTNDSPVYAGASIGGGDVVGFNLDQVAAAGQIKVVLI